jgi:hypothetical protein
MYDTFIVTLDWFSTDSLINYACFSSSAIESGIIPGSFSFPLIVKVFPDEVYP